MTTVKYGLRLKSTGEVLKCDMEPVSNEAEFSVSIIHRLTTCGGYEWLVDTFEEAEYVMITKTPDYNAVYDTPTHNYSPEQLEIVKVTTTVEVETVSEPKIIKVRMKDNAQPAYPGGSYALYNKEGKPVVPCSKSQLTGIEKGKPLYEVKREGLSEIHWYVRDYNESLYEIIGLNCSGVWTIYRLNPKYFKKEDFEIVF